MAPNAFATVERDTDFWFFDGNVVLLAQGNVAFRVHQGVLALHAEFFASKFQQFPQILRGPTEEETIDGCPIIPLDDTAYDIRQLLLSMYRKKYVVPHPPTYLGFAHNTTQLPEDHRRAHFLRRCRADARR